MMRNHCYFSIYGFAVWGLVAGLHAGDAPPSPEEASAAAVIPTRLYGLVAAALYRTPDTDVRLPGSGEPLRRPFLWPDAVEARWTTLAYGVAFRRGYERGRAERLFGLRGIDEPPPPSLLTRLREEARERPPSPDGLSTLVPPAPSDALSVVNGDYGLFCHVAALAACYARQPGDGLTAATHLAALASDDPLAEPCARAYFALLAHVLTRPALDRDAALRSAARDAGNPDVARALLSARLKSTGMLRDESTPLGRLERVVNAWYRHAPARYDAGATLPPTAFSALLADSGGKAGGTPDAGHTPPPTHADAALRRGLETMAHWDARFAFFALAGATHGFAALPDAVREGFRRSRDRRQVAEEWRAFQDYTAFLPVPSGRPHARAGVADAAPAVDTHGRVDEATAIPENVDPARFLIGGKLYVW